MKILAIILLFTPLFLIGQTLNLNNNQIKIANGNTVAIQYGVNTYDNRNTYTQLSSQTITNTLVETSFFNDANAIGTRTIPSELLTAGKVFRINTKADYTCTGNPTNVIRIKAGDSTLTTSTATLTAHTNTIAEISVEITIITTGVSGTCNVMGSTTLVGGASRTLIGIGVGINTTVDNLIDVTYQWGTESAGNILINVSGVIQIMN